MPGRRAAFTGMDTRIAARTLALFVLCAVVPIIGTFLLAEGVISREMRSNAEARLEAASRNYGRLVFERLNRNDQLLAELAAMYLNGQMSRASVLGFPSENFRVVDLVDVGSPAIASSQAAMREGTDTAFLKARE